MMKIMIVLAGLVSLFGCGTHGHPSRIPDGDTIVSFSLSQSESMVRFSGYKYEVRATKEGRVYFRFNEDYPDEKDFYLDDHSVFDTLDAIVRKYHMDQYEFDYQPPVQVFDGYSWDLYVKYASGVIIRSGGYMAGPDNWHEARAELINSLDQWKNLPGMTKELITFKYSYGPRNYELVRKEDHVEVTIDNPETGRHETLEKPIALMDNLQEMAIVERMRENSNRTSEEPNSIPFVFELLYSNGDAYHYKSYDLNYRCHYTEIIQWCLSQWEIDTFD